MAFDFKKLSVAVIEDVAPMRKLLTSVLDAMDTGRILSAENGERGYEIIRRENPDIVVTDWFMSPVDGLALTREIRRNQLSPNRMVPIILVTGYSCVTRVNLARDAGVTEFLVKPFSANDLALRITYVINKPRDFIDAPDFFGPDRRRKKDASYRGGERRKEKLPPR